MHDRIRNLSHIFSHMALGFDQLFFLCYEETNGSSGLGAQMGRKVSVLLYKTEGGETIIGKTTCGNDIFLS